MIFSIIHRYGKRYKSIHNEFLGYIEESLGNFNFSCLPNIGDKILLQNQSEYTIIEIQHVFNNDSEQNIKIYVQ